MTFEQEAALEFHRHEMNIGPSSFEKWVARVEKIVGHDLDGDDSEAARLAGTSDGYSLDGALDAFNAGMSVSQYAQSIKGAR